MELLDKERNCRKNATGVERILNSSSSVYILEMFCNCISVRYTDVVVSKYFWMVTESYKSCPSFSVVKGTIKGVHGICRVRNCFSCRIFLEIPLTTMKTSTLFHSVNNVWRRGVEFLRFILINRK